MIKAAVEKSISRNVTVICDSLNYIRFLFAFFIQNNKIYPNINKLIEGFVMNYIA